MTSTTSNNPTAFLTNPSVQLDVTRYLGTTSDYVNRGIIMKLPDNTEFYAAGTRQTKNGVIILPDYSGWNSGRVRNLCDFFGDHNCFAVVPNFSAKGYEGNGKRKFFLALFLLLLSCLSFPSSSFRLWIVSSSF
jgi:hypothetical protein